LNFFFRNTNFITLSGCNKAESNDVKVLHFASDAESKSCADKFCEIKKKAKIRIITAK
jgi:hypothetical protein